VRVHASGHGRRGDILKLISYLKPRHVMPVHGDPLHFHAFLQFIENVKVNVAITEGHRIYALREEPVFIESVPDETCLVEPGEIHFGETIYRERNHMAEQGICLVVMQPHRFEVAAIDYVGVMSETKLAELKGRLLAEAQAVGGGRCGQPSRSPREKVSRPTRPVSRRNNRQESVY
jgi:mRNA degradation ribonuclease J1/J2